MDAPDALPSAARSGNLSDFYQVGLFGYCEGETDAATERHTVTHCSAGKLPFHFDPVTVWQLNDTGVLTTLGEHFEKGVEVYGKGVEWMHWVFVFALALSLVELGVGMAAIFSRWGSLWTTIASAVSLFVVLDAHLLKRFG